MPDNYRRDEITQHYSRTDTAQSDALVRLRAEKAAQAVLDREAAAKDIAERWAAQQVAATRPAPAPNAADDARNLMIRRSMPGYQPPVLMPVGHAARVHAAAEPSPSSIAGKARGVMMRRGGK